MNLSFYRAQTIGYSRENVRHEYCGCLVSTQGSRWSLSGLNLNVTLVWVCRGCNKVRLPNMSQISVTDSDIVH